MLKGNKISEHFVKSIVFFTKISKKNFSSLYCNIMLKVSIIVIFEKRIPRKHENTLSGIIQRYNGHLQNCLVI